MAHRCFVERKGSVLTIDGLLAPVTFGYDALNRRTNMTDAVGTTVWTYDALGRLATERGPFGTNVVSVGYDEDGRMTSVVYGAYSARYSYDVNGRITGIQAPEGGYSFAYSSNGFKRTLLTYPNGVKETRGYDALTRMTNLVYKKWLTTLLSIDYRYDAGDRRTNEVWSTGRHLSYGYDRAHQLTDVTSPTRASDRASYRYDKAGNPIRRTELGFGVTNSFNNLNQIVSGIWTGGAITVAGAVNYPAGTVIVAGVTGTIYPDRTFDATNVTVTMGTNVLSAIYHGPAFTNTQMVATDKVTVVVGNAAYTHDGNGNLTGDQNFTYQYDLANRLTNVILKASNVSVLAISYDGLGRRIQVVRNGTTIERYVYFPGSFLVLAILDGSNAVKEIYTHGPDLSGTVGGAGGIGGILSVTTNISQSTARKHLHADAMGNVVLVSDSEGTQVASYGFTPFGKLVNQVGSYQARFLFSSKEFDGETGTLNFGYRLLSPDTGHWLTRDALHELGGVNLYGFVLNSPLTLVDTDGRAPYGANNPVRGPTGPVGPSTPENPEPTDPTVKEEVDLWFEIPLDASKQVPGIDVIIGVPQASAWNLRQVSGSCSKEGEVITDADFDVKRASVKSIGPDDELRWFPGRQPGLGIGGKRFRISGIVDVTLECKKCCKGKWSGVMGGVHGVQVQKDIIIGVGIGPGGPVKKIKGVVAGGRIALNGANILLQYLEQSKLADQACNAFLTTRSF